VPEARAHLAFIRTLDHAPAQDSLEAERHQVNRRAGRYVQAINESVAMMLYVAQKYGPTSLLPTADDALMARVFQLTLFGETEIGMNLNPLLAAHAGAEPAITQVECPCKRRNGIIPFLLGADDVIE
jgi:hypothetical protein